MYNIYHIPGKKIGVTRNLNNRVTEQQGYAPDEYEVLFTSDDIEAISKLEIELQKSYGYKVDRQTYRNLIKSNKMKINATEQTSTFPYPLNKLKGNLLDNLGVKWSTDHGDFEITKDNVHWIMQNAKTSMYNDARSYIYNKAFYEAFYNPVHAPDVDMLLMMADNEVTDTSERFDLIRNWAATRGLYSEGNSHTQYVKLQEEAGELAKALLKNDKPEVIDAIGDMVVVLTNLAHLEGYNIEYCIDEAYKVIAARTGKMINGTFVKDK
jgi:NTP pyrophosphatase (non-canonical NTP hydrolase)